MPQDYTPSLTDPNNGSNPAIGHQILQNGVLKKWNGTQYVPVGSTPQGTGGTQTTGSVNGGPVPITNPVKTGNTNTAGADIVPGKAQGPGQINVVDATGSIIEDPSILMGKAGTLTGQNTKPSTAEIKAGTIDPTAAKYKMDADKLDQTAGTVKNVATGTAQTATAAPSVQAATGKVSTAVAPKATDAAQVTTKTTQQDVANAQMTAAQGTLSQQAQVNADDALIDTEAVAAGQTGTGQALKEYAHQNIANVIDTTTMAGKILAQQLGEGNYTDSKATIKGQLDILQAEFTDPATGEPRIPSWAAGTARNVGRIASFTGMTGTAATAAMAQALMEASLPIAQEDAKFFQTVTLKNLDNKQEATINRANVLAKMDLANMDARMTAAVETANNFMQMDLANLSNEQQARVINTQARVQSILEDAKAENTTRLFMAESQNEKDMFYANLQASISQFNAAQKNSMAQFNASEINDTRQFNAAQRNDMSKFNTEQKNQMSMFNAGQKNTVSMFNVGQQNEMKKFNADMENNREQFYKSMQFQIDTANTKWRQTITLQEDQQKFEAAAFDTKNRLDIQTEMLNRLWDRSDSLLDYAWKSAENEADRKNQLNLQILQNKGRVQEAEQEGWGSLWGTLAGAGASALLGMFGL